MSAQSQNYHNILSFFLVLLSPDFMITFVIFQGLPQLSFPQFEAEASLEFLPVLIPLLSIVFVEFVGNNDWYFWAVPMLAPNHCLLLSL